MRGNRVGCGDFALMDGVAAEPWVAGWREKKRSRGAGYACMADFFSRCIIKWCHAGDVEFHAFTRQSAQPFP